ncbi:MULTISPECIES: glycosyltransferase family 4 protein [Methanobacterium]|uniref:Glycosyltransferase family 4 protein n=1 Tax=Methanobacterium veterum TaxID=408577 RepID=A0A9E4ZY36_9EURY|nr:MULTISPECIES: glycosyltransferase family 4 protein [Methanobacterium]MCZ3367519.1 glycosyltransferase family 4 protein [Methanobacterium veterum]MCZ3373333.1 glycosyltransferase family 4 protein [Methanobacterium veterum]
MKNKADKLKMVCIGQLLSDGTGIAGGARFKNMMSIFENIGIEINLISFSFFSDKFYIEHKKDESFKTTVVHLPKNLPKYLKALAIFPVFYYAFKESKNSDFIFSDFITEISYIPAIITGKIRNKPVILDFIDTNFFKIIPDFIRKYSARSASMIFAISYYLHDFAKYEYKCKNVSYIPNGINTNSFKMDKISRDKKRKELHIRKNDIVIGYTGSFAYYEGIPILLEAFKKLSEKYPSLKLAIMGKIYFSGDNDIEKLVKTMKLNDKIILIPSKPYEEVPKYLSAFDILCCSKIDCKINRVANPIKVVEYLSMELPTVCSAVGGIIDTIDDGNDGFLVTPGDVKSLEKKIEWIILNSDEAHKIAHNGRETVLNKYSYGAIENTVKEALNKMKKI